MKKRILLIGSGPIVIGQSAEFDYAGVQALLMIKSEGHYCVVLNSNPATIMTDKTMADKIYIEPMSIEVIEKILIKEKITDIIASFGGQTALNLACKLHDEGILQKLNINILGTQISSVKVAEDRDLFRKFLISIGENVIESDSFNNVYDALKFAHKIEFPVMIRSAFTLAGAGSGIVNSKEEFLNIAKLGIEMSQIGQIIVEKSLYGWKELEYEVVRDASGTAISICNMENLDPVGVHTGESVVITPSQTLTDKAYQDLRTLSLKIVNGLDIRGACNVQIALSPDNKKYYIIEVNPRLSRSSALASKATGYPIAKIAAKIALGQNLCDIKNIINGNSSAVCEPVVDYIVLKFPKWAFEKLKVKDKTIGTQMKSTGEVMTIDRSFEAGFLKGMISIYGERIFDIPENFNQELWLEKIKTPNSERFLQILHLLINGVDIDSIHKNTAINEWFLKKISNLILQKDLKHKLLYKKIDSCSAEFECKSNYFYSTHDEIDECEIPNNDKKSILVIGSGPNAIGQGIEFDYTAVHMIKAISNAGYYSIMMNNNPETLSTDFDISNFLFFDPLSKEYLLSIVNKFNPYGVIFQCGGQVALKLAFDAGNIKILGSSIETMKICEDRKLFKNAMIEAGILYPNTQIIESKSAANINIVFPVICRPSFVIGGRGIEILHSQSEFLRYINEIDDYAYPIVVDEYVKGIEVEIDAISDGKNVFIPAILEHIEESGVHSGDSMSIYPDSLSDEMRGEILEITKKACQKLNIIGFLNIQFIIKDGKIYTIEINPRASRTIPIINKIMKLDMAKMALDVMLGCKLEASKLLERKNFYACKTPVYSNKKIPQSCPNLSSEMKSTGEVMGIAKTKDEAIYKSMLAAGYKFSDDSKIYFMSDSLNILDNAEKINTKIEMQNVLQNMQTYDVFVNLSNTEFTSDQVRNIQYFSNINTFKAYLIGSEFGLKNKIMIEDFEFYI